MKGFILLLWKYYLQAATSVSRSEQGTKKNKVNVMEIKPEHDLRKIIYQTQNEKSDLYK